MKGTIDITIKRKDGTVEKRQEHNVAFDLPSFTIKEWIKYPVQTMYASSVVMEKLQGTYKSMFLSEEEMDLTKPSWRPIALKTISSGSSSTWHTALASATNNDKKRILTAAWTMPSDEGFSLTLKSIAWGSNVQFASRPPSGDSENRPGSVCFTKGIAQTYYYYYSSYGTYYYGQYPAKKFKVSDYKFENTAFNGFGTGKLSEGFYMPYSLGLVKTVNGEQKRTKDGRFAFVNSDNVINSYPVPSTSYNTLAIFDDETEQAVLSFPLSQFTNYSNSHLLRTIVLNTGTKNWLIQNDTSIGASRVWQIPDTQTSEAIAPTSETFLQGISLKDMNSNDERMGIIGNYLVISGSVYKVSDELAVTTYKGASNGAENGNSKGYTIGYLDEDYVSFVPQTVSISGNTLPSGALQPYFANLTASNFSTPITLAAGDVLSVSYSISVA